MLSCTRHSPALMLTRDRGSRDQMGRADSRTLRNALRPEHQTRFLPDTQSQRELCRDTGLLTCRDADTCRSEDVRLMHFKRRRGGGSHALDAGVFELPEINTLV